MELLKKEVELSVRAAGNKQQVRMDASVERWSQVAHVPEVSLLVVKQHCCTPRTSQIISWTTTLRLFVENQWMSDEFRNSC